MIIGLIVMWLLIMQNSFSELQKSLEIAQNMLKENMPIEVISKLTGLLQEEIEKLKD